MFPLSVTRPCSPASPFHRSHANLFFLSSSRTIDLSHSAFTEKAHDLECAKLGADSDSHGLSFQFKMSVMGEAVASSVVTLIRNRPSEATAYC